MKGLCWHCYEKWSKEHRCKHEKLLMIEPIEEEPKVEELDSDHEGVETNEDIEVIIYTVHVLAGYTNP